MKSKNYPLVTVITPSYNQAPFIRETIESVLTQDYSNLEYIVIDGGSNDGTLEILKGYNNIDSRFNFVSEPDKGQSEAINKGLKMAKGQIIGWLNSDDTYHPHAIRRAVKALVENPEWGMVYGNAYATDEENKILHSYPVESFSKRCLFERCIICQPAAFIRKEIFEEVGGVDETFFFCMDYELWMRIARKSEIGYIKTYLANSRCHDSAKTTLYWKDIGIKECMLASLKNHGTVSNMMICDFINLNYEKEIEWIIKQLKFFEIFGPGPKIKNINLLNGNEVHNCSNISMKVESNEPLYALLIKGKDIDLGTNELNIYLNEKLIKEYFIKESSFTFIILIPCQNSDCNIKIVQRSTSASRIHQLNTKREQVLVSDYIIPLSEPEYEFTQMMYKNIKFIGKWLKENRKVNPFDY